MQSNISSTVPFVDIVLVIAVLVIALVLLFKITQFINSRPDLTALFSIAAMVAGYGLIASNSSQNGLLILAAGVVGLFASALNYRRLKEAK